MTTQTEALKLALEALELDSFYGTKKQEAITAIKEALAQPEQEPVAHMNQHGVIHEAGYPWGPTNRLEPLYTTPPQRKPLTDEQRKEIAKGWRGRNWTVGDIIDAIEAAHGIKE